jgi:hypothetical protein
MDPNALLVKSQKGVEEIESRAHGLSHKLRGALIMIDGESTFAQILDRCGEFRDRVQTQILELALDGYIETVNESGELVEDGLGLIDQSTQEVANAPVDMRDFSRPVRPKGP